MPQSIPKRVATIVDEGPDIPEVGVQGGMVGGVKDGIVGGVLDSIPHEGPAPPPPAQPVQRTVTTQKISGPVSIDAIPGGRVRLAVPIHKVEPVYPALARQARVSGVVELEGIIAVDGHLRDLRIKSGPALLVKAAYDAVKQWIYAPTTLNEQPVEVIAPITVTFRLN